MTAMEAARGGMTPTSSDIRIDRHDAGRVVVVTIDRQHRRNACDRQAWRDLTAAFDALVHDSQVRLVVLTGAGGHFCAGDDIIAFRSVMADSLQADAHRADIQQCYRAVQSLARPVVAAISGVCVGGGLSLALACDFRVADRSARIGVPLAKLGLLYPTVQLVRLTHLIGVAQARRWLYSGASVDAAEAAAVGFLDDVCESGDTVIAHAQRFCAEMMDVAPLSIAGSKLQLNAIAAGTLQSDDQAIAAIVRLANDSDDYHNAAGSFAARSAPIFTGR